MASLSNPETTGRAADHRSSPHPGLRIALAQLALEDGDLAHNMELAEHGQRGSTATGRIFFCLPEAADFCAGSTRRRDDALPLPDRTDFLASLARRHGIWISRVASKGRGPSHQLRRHHRSRLLVHLARKIETLPEHQSSTIVVGATRPRLETNSAAWP